MLCFLRLIIDENNNLLTLDAEYDGEEVEDLGLDDGLDSMEENDLVEDLE